MTPAFQLDMTPYLANVSLVELQLKNAAGQIVSSNLYWLAEKDIAYRAMARMVPVALTATAKSTRTNGETNIVVHLQNSSTTAALATKLTLEHASVAHDSDDIRILPAYYSDNYISLLPGEAADVTIAAPDSAAKGSIKIAIRGWNVTPTSIPVE